jgi:hypothetical protein
MDKQGHFEKGKWISQECIECNEHYVNLLKACETYYKAQLSLAEWKYEYPTEKLEQFKKMTLWQRLRWAITGRMG